MLFYLGEETIIGGRGPICNCNCWSEHKGWQCNGQQLAVLPASLFSSSYLNVKWWKQDSIAVSVFLERKQLSEVESQYARVGLRIKALRRLESGFHGPCWHARSSCLFIFLYFYFIDDETMHISLMFPWCMYPWCRYPCANINDDVYYTWFIYP